MTWANINFFSEIDDNILLNNKNCIVDVIMIQTISGSERICRTGWKWFIINKNSKLLAGRLQQTRRSTSMLSFFWRALLTFYERCNVSIHFQGRWQIGRERSPRILRESDEENEVVDSHQPHPCGLETRHGWSLSSSSSCSCCRS